MTPRSATASRLVLGAALLALLLRAGAASAEASADDEAAELAKKLQNPVAALISVPFQSNFEWGGGRQDVAHPVLGVVEA